MMLRVLGYVMFAGVVLVGAIACEGGDKPVNDGPSDSAADASSGYAAGVAALLSTSELREASAANDEEQVRELLGTYVRKLRSLTPPPELLLEHARYADALDELFERFDAEADARVVEVESAYIDAFATHYEVILWLNQGAAMEPAYAADEILLICQRDGTINRWQTILFQSPLDLRDQTLTRVVGMPGESVEIRNGVVWINNAILVGDVYAKEPSSHTIGKVYLPPDHYLVLGDNRGDSFDDLRRRTLTAPITPNGQFFGGSIGVRDPYIKGELPPGNAKVCPTIAQR